MQGTLEQTITMVSCEVTKREVFLGCLILLAYFLPSGWRNELVDKLSNSRGSGPSNFYAGNHQKFVRAEDEEDQPKPVNPHDTEDTRGWKPPVPQPTSLKLYDNPNELVHVIHTRFMQHQPHLDHLGMARVELFKTFTLPSIQKQSNQDFLWIIWMDPELESNVKQALIDLVKDVSNCVVIGSNAKMPYIRSDFYDRSVLLESTIFSGDPDLLADYHEASLSRVVLHTEIDSDDALFYDFVRSIQREAVQSLKHSTLKYDFRLWCVFKRIEWKYYNAYDDSSTSGFLEGIKSLKKECPSGGYTKGYGIVTEATDLPAEPRHEIHSHTPTCDFTQHKCIARIHGGASEYAVLRARTPTANGMTGVMPKISKNADKYKEHQLDLWKTLPRNFGVSQKDVEATRAKLEKNMVDIILQNLEGQCKEGYSCKHSSKEHLKELKAKYRQGDKQTDDENQETSTLSKGDDGSFELPDDVEDYPLEESQKLPNEQTQVEYQEDFDDYNGEDGEPGDPPSNELNDEDEGERIRA